MEIPAEINNWLTQCIEKFVAGNDEPEYLRNLSERYQLLPILVDWNGFFGLRADGESSSLTRKIEMNPW